MCSIVHYIGLQQRDNAVDCATFKGSRKLPLANLSIALRTLTLENTIKSAPMGSNQFHIRRSGPTVRSGTRAFAVNMPGRPT